MKKIVNESREERPCRRTLHRQTLEFDGVTFDVEVWIDESAGRLCLQVAGGGWVDKHKSDLRKMIAKGTGGGP